MLIQERRKKICFGDVSAYRYGCPSVLNAQALTLQSALKFYFQKS